MSTTAPDGVPIGAVDFTQPVTDLRDLRVLIPSTRRAIDGPTALASGSISTTLNDEEVLGLIADAASNVILQTGGADVFGYMLVPTSRDPFYLAINGWATDQARSSDADVVIRCQAALDFFFNRAIAMKTAETIKDEGQEWTWEISASMLRDQLKLLQQTRDAALEKLAARAVPLDAYYSFVAERDPLAALAVEPYATLAGNGQHFWWTP
jgi:hypothetical protein